MDHTGINPVEYKFCYVTYSDEASGKKKSACPATEHSTMETVQSWIGKKIRIQTNGQIRCTICGKPTSKSFGQGACFSCFSEKAETDLCILRPETCHFHKGTCREPDWGKTNCFKTHTVYFANSSGLKVGITKENPVSNRWVDQGASFGIPVLTVDSRYAAGVIESYLSQFMPDKTSWQKMIQSEPEFIDLLREKNKFLAHLQKQTFYLNTTETKKSELIFQPAPDSTLTEIRYPIQAYPKKIKSLKLSPDSMIFDRLTGIKGQYLLFESGAINIRSQSGLQFSLEVLDE